MAVDPSTHRALSLLDVEGGGAFVLSDYHPADLPRAVDLPWTVVLQVLDDAHLFAQTVLPSDARVPALHLQGLLESWAVHNGLPDPQSAQRLVWILGRHRDAVEVDLARQGIDLGELWRARKWRLLLNLMDHAPRTSWLTYGLTEDQGYFEQLKESGAFKPKLDSDTPASPPLTDWSPEVAMLASLVDAVRAVQMTLIAVNSKEGSPKPKFDPAPRPVTLLDRMSETATRQARWEAHDSLAERLLGKRKADV